MRRTLAIGRTVGIWVFGLLASAIFAALLSDFIHVSIFRAYGPNRFGLDDWQPFAVGAMCAFACFRLWSGSGK
jgi:hypothetical protein